MSPLNYFRGVLSSFRNSFRPGPFGLISKDPPIVHISYFGDRYFSLFYVYRISFRHRNENLYYLSSISFNLEPSRKLKLRVDHGLFKLLFPKHQVIFLANLQEQQKLIEGLGIRCIFCNKNAFADERIFKPLSNTTRKFDAVYDARLAPQKRHWLIKEIRSLALITYHVEHLNNLEYSNKLKEDIDWAYYPNYKTLEYEFLEPAEVNSVLNISKVGLSLSQQEGSNMASIQYLLAGIPVCTTKNLGGRDEFFDKEYVIWADDDQGSVKDAVRQLISRDLDPQLIRRAVMRKVERHRDNYKHLVQEIYTSEGVNRDFNEEWDQVFFNKMLSWEISSGDLLKKKSAESAEARSA